MDFTGLNRFNAYKLNRPLTVEEEKGELSKKQSVGVESLDWLSTIKINNTYLELVDRWYAGRGFSSWLGLMFMIPFSMGVAAFFWLMIEKNTVEIWAGGAFVVLLFSLIVLAGVWVIKHDAFRMTHYPIRLNRKTRKVYAYRPNGTIIKASWDDLFICKMKNKLTMGQISYDIRANILDKNNESVKDTFTLGYPYMGDEEGLLQLWEYIRCYMEESDGVERSYQTAEILLPINGQREGLAFGIIRVFSTTANHMLMQLLMSPIEALNVLGRWFSMCTCKVPCWPKEIEAECKVDPDDPYQKDWRSNGKYDFWELGWPVICFMIGLAVDGVAIAWVVKELF
ncbi:DUF6708 domain-containing protein [Halomonas binhaiensis]|uniref:DUF6708 domain-containing protein n=1 Tax=Halomonas binhaiensis TaxID=2562282 RepID=A0A5C1NKR7_9GAMM|nr:DUF6708 domain-containing protein [Halomonas binhaiensis]QEM82958.1 hypothetical protein E4T21_16425 [Halomonas binhaiensis]